jgi:hypothetical protein
MIVVAMLVGVWQLFRPVEPTNIVPLLGVIDPPVSKPTPKPKPTPTPLTTPSASPS